MCRLATLFTQLPRETSRGPVMPEVKEGREREREENLHSSRPLSYLFRHVGRSLRIEDIFTLKGIH